MDPLLQRRVRVNDTDAEGVITMAALGKTGKPVGTMNVVVTLDDSEQVSFELPPPGTMPAGVALGPITFLT